MPGGGSSRLGTGRDAVLRVLAAGLGAASGNGAGLGLMVAANRRLQSQVGCRTLAQVPLAPRGVMAELAYRANEMPQALVVPCRAAQRGDGAVLVVTGEAGSVSDRGRLEAEESDPGS